jgi:CRISPR-associated Csx2 family protein
MTAIASTLLTFVGRTAANRAYRQARYRFDDGVEVESKLFAAAALSWMQRGKQPPNRMLVVGTPTSGWDVLMELVERLAPSQAEEALEWAIPVSEALAVGAVAPESLRSFEQRFSHALGVRLDLLLAQNDGESVFAALHGALAPNERVVLDITHSYRSMPVHALVSLGALRWLKGVQLGDIVYGSLDETDPAGVSAARSLGSTSALAQATPALAQLALVDDVGSIAPYLACGNPELGKRLEDTQRLEAIMQFDSAAQPRGQALGTLREFGGSPALAATASMLRETLESMNKGCGSRGLLNRARRALGKQDYMRAVGLANEALALRVVELHDLRRKAAEAIRASAPADSDLYRTLNRLARAELARNADREDAPRLPPARPYASLQRLNAARNSVMHAGSSISGQTAPQELLSADSLRALLEWSFRFYEFLE